MSAYYFAYGSYMLARCLQMHAPSAQRFDQGKLSKFRFDFAGYSESNHGANATVVPDPNATVWGVIWKMEPSELEALDKLEIANGDDYNALYQCIECTDGSKLLCRMHQHTQPPYTDHDDPLMRWKTLPSATYLDAIKEGAKESNLPEEYIAHLFSLRDNGRSSTLDTIADLEIRRPKE